MYHEWSAKTDVEMVLTSQVSIELVVWDGLLVDVTIE
jgi:hypothetical protein